MKTEKPKYGIRNERYYSTGEATSLINSGELHHITFRNQGTLWERLWFYKKDPEGFRGYSVAGCVNKNDPDYEKAFQITKGLGIHVGYYGNG